jgi:hypothetical protein
VPAVVFGIDTVRKETEMFKKIITDLRTVVILIATENLSALRVVLKSMMNLASRSIRLDKKS